MSDPREVAENSPVQMQAVIALLLKGATTTQIAAELDIPRARILRWYRTSDEFGQMLAETEADVVRALRDEFVSDAVDLVADLLPQARQALADALDPDKEVPASVRVGAAAHVFRLAGGRSTDGIGAKPRPVVGMESVVRSLDARPAAGD